MYFCRYIAKKNFLYQHIDTPTRARGTSIPHLLDLVITDEQFIENIDFQAPLGKSDHSMLLISCNVNPSAHYLPKKCILKGRLHWTTVVAASRVHEVN